MIPQIEPSFGKEEADALSRYILSGGWGTEHLHTKVFEKLIAGFVGVKYCSAVNNGTVGLIIALLSIGVKPGDEVIVPALTMVATANAVRFIGAIPKFVDIEEHTLCLDIDETRKSLTKNTKAIIYVSLNGRCGDIERLKGDIPIIEDACQSLGSSHRGKKLGTLGELGVYSLSPHKIISTGQGGLIVTDNQSLYEKVERLKDFGRLSGGSDIHEEFGINCKFTDFQAIIGIEQFKKLPERINKKKEIYHTYQRFLAKGRMLVAPDVPWMVDVYGIYGKNERFQTRNMYPVVPYQPCYAENGNYPIAHFHSLAGIWLPSSCSLTTQDIEGICREINA